jgi:hypothetical protein
MNLEDVPELFNRLPWHDSKLRGVCVQHRGNIDDVILDIELWDSNYKLIPVKIVLEDTSFFLCDLDLRGKRACSDDISDAICCTESELKNKIQEERLPLSPVKLEADALKNDFHFWFYLIPPGGTIDVIAANFRLIKSKDFDPLLSGSKRR